MAYEWTTSIWENGKYSSEKINASYSEALLLAWKAFSKGQKYSNCWQSHGNKSVILKDVS